MQESIKKQSGFKTRTLQEIKEWSKSILWGAIFVYFFTGYVFKAYRVEGTSMQPLLQDGQRLFVNRLLYKLRDINRGDVVVFYYPAKPEDYYIKRVLGLPGEKIQVKNGVVFVNGKRIDDHFVPNYFKSYENVAPKRIPKGHYFVSGDHRNKSYDSRKWSKDRFLSAYVPQKYIIGKASFRYWPLPQFGLIKANFNKLPQDQ